MTTDQFKKQIKKLPAKPGIYIFKGPTLRPLQQVQDGQAEQVSKPLYIGKALNLKNRLKSYLKTENPRLRQMALEARKIDFIETESDIEALILESQYIKKYKPDFNIRLRDDKQYSFVGFTQEEYSKIFVTHQPTQFRNSNLETRNKSQILNSKLKTVSDFRFRASDFQYIGPFTDAGAIKTTLRLLRKIFPYCTCKQTHHNYCLNYHIEKCLGFCCLKQQNPNLKFKNQNAKLYGKNIKAIKKILSGKQSSLIKNLEKEMKILGKKKKYEKALELQCKVEKLRRVFQNAKIINKTPSFMIYHKDSRAIDSLQKLLNLRAPLHRIEAYDIANIQDKHAVGSMVVFENGKPNKNEYRKFKIRNSNLETRNKSQILNSKFKTVSDLGLRVSDFHPGGDTGMLKEVLARRFNHPEWATPDLILVDGGKAQLSAATAATYKFKSLNPKQILNSKFQIPILALTKNDKHIGNKIVVDNKKEILLSKLPINIKNLLLQINAEAHRFAISYYRKIHRKDLKFTT